MAEIQKDTGLRQDFDTPFGPLRLPFRVQRAPSASVLTLKIGFGGGILFVFGATAKGLLRPPLPPDWRGVLASL